MLLLAAVPALLFAALLASGAWVWWLTGRTMRRRARQRSRYGLDAQAALWRHPAGRARWPRPGEPAPREPDAPPSASRPAGPDDDPDFIRALERMLRGEDGGLA